MPIGFPGRFGRGFAAPGTPGEGTPPTPNYDPIAALGSDLIEYWDASRADTLGVTTDATYTNAVNSWTGLILGSNMANSTPGLKPIYEPTGMNGRPCIKFDGSAQYLTCTDSGLLAALPSGATASEMWMLLTQEALAADTTERYAGGWAGSSVITGRTISRIVTSSVNRARGRTGIGASATSANDTVVDFSDTHVVRVINGATVLGLEVDGGTKTTIAAVPSTTNTRFRAGAIPAAAASNYWQGRIAAILVTKSLTDEKATALHGYLG